MNFEKTTLDNGLRVICTPMPSMESATVEVLVKAGTRNETQKVNGLAHFLEHMVFKGTEKYPSSEALSSLIEGLGGEINASTSKESTTFYIKVLERHLETAFDILSELIQKPLFDSQELELERGVILEEIAMYEDRHEYRVHRAFEELLYKNMRLGMDTSGTKESVQRIKRNDFVSWIDKFYTSSNMALSIAGKFDREKILDLARKYLGTVKGENKKGRERSSSRKINSGKKPEIQIVNKKAEQAHIILGVRGNPLGHQDRYQEAVLSAVLGKGMSSRLFREVRERRGLAYYVMTYLQHYSDNGYLAARAGVRLNQVEEAIKIILAEFQKVKDETLKEQAGGLSDKEIARAKELLKGRLALTLEDTHEVADYTGEQELMEGRVKTIKEVMDGIDAVIKQDIWDVAEEFFQNHRLNLAIVGPYDDPEKFKQLFRF